MGIFGNRKHHFEADITIFPLGPTTRRTHPFNGIRWDLCYPEDVDERGLAKKISMVWPEFVDETGNPIPANAPLQGNLHARMHVLVPEMVAQHRQRLQVGDRFFCTEGPRRVAEGVVTSLCLADAKAKSSAANDQEQSTVELQWGGTAYWCTPFQDNVGGCAGMELRQFRDGTTTLVAKITYWDATGEYWLETLGIDVPLTIIDRLVAATKSFVGPA